MQVLGLFPCLISISPHYTGKKSNTAEKQFPPAEPLEPVLPGSSAIGSVSLAVARAGALLQGLPLYRHIAALKTQEVSSHNHKNTIPRILRETFNNIFNI